MDFAAAKGGTVRGPPELPLDAMKPNVRLLVPALLASYLSCAAARATAIEWAGPAGGLWNVASNWSPPQVPGTGDSASIPAGHSSVSIDTNVSLSGLSVGGGATLEISAGGLLTLAGDTQLYGSLTNRGTVSWQDGDIYVFNEPTLGWSGQLNNAAGALFDIACDRTLANNQGSPQFHNAGTLRKSAGTDGTDLNVFLDSTGTVEVQNGPLNLNAGGNLGGTFQAAAGAALYLVSGAFNMLDTPFFQGPGAVGSHGNVVLTGALGGVFGTYGGSLDPGSLLTVAAGATLNVANAITLYGSLTNAGNLNITSDMYLYGPLTNSGTLTWQSGELHVSENPEYDWAGEVTNQANGTFDVRCDQAMTNDAGAPRFHNAGLLRKTLGTGSTEIQLGFDNTGTLQAQAGTVQCSGEVAQHSGTTLSGGTWALTNGAIVDFTLGDTISVNQAYVTLDGAACGFDKLTAGLADNRGSLTLSLSLIHI